MFWIRYQDVVSGAYTTLTLAPAPTSVEYPESRLYTMKTTQDGKPVISRPLRDGRTRKWIWSGYNDSIPTFKNQWAVLKALEYRTRLEAGKPALVEIWEDVIPDSGFGGLTGGTTKVWTTVKFLLVDRQPTNKNGGRVAYESVITFVIEDDSWEAF